MTWQNAGSGGGGFDWRRHRWVVYAALASLVAEQAAQLPLKRLLGGEPYPFLVMPGFPGGGLAPGQVEARPVLVARSTLRDGTTQTLRVAELFANAHSAYWSALGKTLLNQPDPMPREVTAFLAEHVAADEPLAAIALAEVDLHLSRRPDGALSLTDVPATLEHARVVPLTAEAR